MNQKMLNIDRIFFSVCFNLFLYISISTCNTPSTLTVNVSKEQWKPLSRQVMWNNWNTLLNKENRESDYKEDKGTSDADVYSYEDYYIEEEKVVKEENVFLEEDDHSVILQLLIFMCCAAGVFGLCVICCIVCGQLFDSIGNRNRSNEGIANPMEIPVNRGNENTYSFISVHRNPWSPGILEEEGGLFQFENEHDKPPSYEDIDLTKKSEEPRSPSPPPYTPSFGLSNSNEKT